MSWSETWGKKSDSLNLSGMKACVSHDVAARIEIGYWLFTRKESRRGSLCAQQNGVHMYNRGVGWVLREGVRICLGWNLI